MLYELFDCKLKSILTNIVEEPKILLAKLIKLGSWIAFVFRIILSAPALRRDLISSIDLTPPPTVIGIKKAENENAIYNGH